MSNIGGKSVGGGGVGNYKAPAASTSTVRPSHSRKDPSGVAGGLSSRMDFDSEEHGPMYNYSVNPITANANERMEPLESESVSEKGNSFKIC